MSALFPDLLRSFVTNLGLAALLFTLGEPKSGAGLRRAVLGAIVLADMAANIYFYRYGDYSALARFDIAFFVLVSAASKPLFRDKLMQWLFNCLTVMNVYAITVVLSYDLCDLFPQPYYANAALRLVLLAAAVYLFRTRLRPLYRQAAEHWAVYMLVSVCAFLNFAWYFVAGDDVEASLESGFVPLLLLSALTVLVYLAIFLSLRKQRLEYALREENRRMQADRAYLQLSVKAMSDRMALMDEAARQNRLSSHDRRHFNNTVLELLEQGQVSEAAALLKSSAQTPAAEPRSYCENPAVNAAVCRYARLAEDAGIRCDIALNMGAEIPVPALELSMVLSNLMENAIHGCEALDSGADKYIHLVCRSAGRLLMEIENPCAPDVELDEGGQPRAGKDGHGTGSRSVAAFAAKYAGEIIYQIRGGVFRARLLV